MRRYIVCLAALIMSLLMISGCAGSDGDTASSQESTAPAVTVQPTPEPSPEPTPEPARLILEGGESMDWPCGVPFEEPGYTAIDGSGTDRSAEVVVEGEVVCWKLGEYELRYSFLDEKGQEVSALRRVKLLPAEPGKEIATEKVIYLTFDDGPHANTPYILETLAKYDAKATFFVIAQRENSYNYLLPEMEAQGHSIGIHCHDHSYGYLYSSEEVFFNDVLTAQQIYYENLGHYASISRFPGGGATAYSYFQRTVEGGFAQIEQRLKDMGIRYFDWNIQEAETGTLDTYYIFRGYVPKFDMPIFLQHDARDYSIAALEDMLKWGTENGYEFRAITDSTPQCAYEPNAYY